MTVKPLSDETIRRRDVRAKIEWPQIKALIAGATMADLGLPGAAGVDGVVAEVELTQAERGSPSYRISEWSAIVKVTLPIDHDAPHERVGRGQRPG